MGQVPAKRTTTTKVGYFSISITGSVMSTTFPYDDEKDEMMKMEMMSTTAPYVRGSFGT